jgi:hypothetical protein
MRIRDDFCRCGFVFGGLVEAIWRCLGFDYVSGREAKEW